MLLWFLKTQFETHLDCYIQRQLMKIPKKKKDFLGRKCMKIIDHVSAFLRFDLTIELNILMSKE